MPSGRVHAKTSLALSIPAFLLGLGVTRDWAFASCCAAGCLAGIPLTPDLDQEGISSSEYAIIKWTMGLGFFWTAIWFPYARCCKHRGFASHFPFVSTLIRVVYLSVIVGVVFYFFKWSLPRFNPWLGVWFAIGLLISDIAHWAMDVKFGDPFPHKEHRRPKQFAEMEVR